MTNHRPGPLSDGVLRLLRGPIDSFEKLEVVIALRTSELRPWTLEDLEERTGAPAIVLTRALDELVATGLVEERSGTWRISASGELAAVDELVSAWSTGRAEVLAVMTERSLSRIRASAARRFADAFRFRNGGEPGRGGDDG